MTDVNRNRQPITTGMDTITIASVQEGSPLTGVAGRFTVSGAPHAPDNRDYDVRGSVNGDRARLNGLLQRYHAEFGGQEVRNVDELLKIGPQ